MATARDHVRSFAVRHRWATIIAAIGFVVLAGLFGGDVQSHLKSGGFEASDAESARASTLLEDEFGAGDPDVVMVITARPRRHEAGRASQLVGTKAPAPAPRTLRLQGTGGTPRCR